MTDEPTKDDDDGGAWIETVAKAAGALGFNAVRVRWKLRRWRDKRLAAAEGRRQRLEHMRYEHKVCPKCTAVNDKAADTCSRCGEKLGGRAMQLARRAGLVPGGVISASGLLMVCIIAVYVRVALAGGGKAWIDQPAELLYAFGGAVQGGEWWRAACAMFLHAGLWHIGFNLFALSVAGPYVQQEYSRGAMLFGFIVTGLVGSVVSLALGGQGIRIGASGAVMGLIGIAAARGHRDGTGMGRAIRDGMLKWAMYTLVFGLIVGADNWAHGGGLVAGIALGYGIDPRWLRTGAGRRLAQIAGVLGLAATLATTAWIMTQPAKRLGEIVRDEVMEPTRIVIRACERHRAGDTDAGLAAYRELAPQAAPEDLDAECLMLEELAGKCRTLQAEGYTEAFGQLPPHLPASQRQQTIELQTEQCALILAR